MTDVLRSPITQTEYKPHPSSKMKAARWMGTRDVEIGLVPKPVITDPGDALVQVTHCTICGSDLHMYEGDLNDAMKKGDILGQEAIGMVEEIGPNVKTVKPGDRVIILAVIACGSCEYCQRQQYSLCDVSNPSQQMESMYGHRYSRLFGGYPGNQAEYCRVPNADLSCIKAPKEIDARKLLPLSKVTTSAWHALELAEVQAGDVVAIWGCGPVGLSVQRLARLRGAKKIYGMDKDPRRLRFAQDFGTTPVDVTAHPDVGEYLLSVEPGGFDSAIEASGFRSIQKVPHAAMRTIGLERDSSDTVAAIIRSLKKGGYLAMIGDVSFSIHDFPIGAMIQKGLTVRGGQADLQKYHPFLLELVVQGKIDPSWMFTFEDDFENIAQHYESFSQHEVPGALKVCLVTAFGRSQRMQASSELVVDKNDDH